MNEWVWSLRYCPGSMWRNRLAMAEEEFVVIVRNIAHDDLIPTPRSGLFDFEITSCVLVVEALLLL